MERDLRHWSRRWSAGVLGGLIALFAFAVPAAEIPIGTKIAIGVGLLVAEFLCYRGIIMGAHADQDALVVTNLVTRRRIAWTDIVDFAVRGRGAERKLVVLRSSGDELTLAGVMPADWAPNREMTLASMEGALRRWLRSARSAA